MEKETLEALNRILDEYLEAIRSAWESLREIDWDLEWEMFTQSWGESSES